MNIYESITAIMNESIAISKDSTNKQQGFKYRGIDAVMNTFYPLFAKHKVFIAPEVLEQTREERTTKSGGNLIYSILRVRYTFYAEDGTNISAVAVGEGMDSADKASNKAMAVAMKYAMFQVFCIPTEEFIDPDSETPPESIKKGQNKDEPKSLTLEEAKNTILNTKNGQVTIDELSTEELKIASKYCKGFYKDAVDMVLAERENAERENN